MRRIKKANIRFISLCPKGANKIDVLYKSDGTVQFSTLFKASDKFDEHGEVTAVVYAPEHRDSQGDIADASVIKEAAYDFIRNGANIDINHDGKPLKAEQARVAETFLVQKGDPRFADWKDTEGKQVNLEGAWAVVLKIDDPELRKKYRNGDWQGVSMGGTAVVEAEKSEDVLSRLAALLNSSQPNDDSMNENDLKKALEPVSAQLTTLTTSMTELVKALTKTEEKVEKKTEEKSEKKDDAPVYRGKPDDLRALEKHARAVQLYELKKAIDFKDPASIREYREQVDILKAEWQEQDEADGIDTEAEEKPVRKAGPARRDGGSGGDETENARQDARALADEINKSRNPALQAK